MKNGANFKDRNRIRERAAAGQDAATISQALRIKVEVIENFMPQAEKPKRKSRAKPKVDAPEVIEADTEESIDAS